MVEQSESEATASLNGKLKGSLILKPLCATPGPHASMQEMGSGSTSPMAASAPLTALQLLDVLRSMHDPSVSESRLRSRWVCQFCTF